jgi:hypothetical protein
MNPVLDYLGSGLLLTLKELGLLLGPAFFFGLLLHYLAEGIRWASLSLMRFNLFAWLTAPGTVVHELGHAFFCILFGHEVRELALFRPKDPDSLGHVKHAYNPRNLYQMVGHFFIGSGPIWFGAAVLYGLALLLLGGNLPLGGIGAGLTLDDFPVALGRMGMAGLDTFRRLLDPSLFGHWPVYLFLYLAFSIGAHMTLSLSDLGGTFKGFAFLAGLVLLLNYATLWTGDGSARVCLFLLRPLGVIYSVMAFAMLLSACLALVLTVIAVVAQRQDKQE